MVACSRLLISTEKSPVILWRRNTKGEERSGVTEEFAKYSRGHQTKEYLLSPTRWTSRSKQFLVSCSPAVLSDRWQPEVRRVLFLLPLALGNCITKCFYSYKHNLLKICTQALPMITKLSLPVAVLCLKLHIQSPPRMEGLLVGKITYFYKDNIVS